MLPIDIIQTKRGDFALAQTVDREQHQDSAVTHPRWTTRIYGREQPLHLRPREPHRQSFLSINPRPLNGLCKMRPTPALLSTEAKKRAQGVNHVSNGDAYPSL